MYPSRDEDYHLLGLESQGSRLSWVKREQVFIDSPLSVLKYFIIRWNRQQIYFPLLWRQNHRLPFQINLLIILVPFSQHFKINLTVRIRKRVLKCDICLFPLSCSYRQAEFAVNLMQFILLLNLTRYNKINTNMFEYETFRSQYSPSTLIHGLYNPRSHVRIDFSEWLWWIMKVKTDPFGNPLK